MNQTVDLHNHLIEACKNNDAKAQMLLYDKYCKAMCAIAYRYVKDVFEAEDIMQDAFIKAFQKIDSFKGDVSFGAWLKRIVINQSLDVLKKKKLDLIAINDEIHHKVEEDETWEVEVPYTQEMILSVIETLKEKYRVVLSLFLLEGYDHQEISEVLGISEVASRTHLLRGKAQLKERLKEQHYVEGY
ncbi:RNA polymerase sigma factor [Polaribacter pacificus]|uniref:RNA polymerase sigma factor n=1 Tax=Polaribacter pacificus TaxID=1775173 RepID=A0A917MH95_9FLAO|nr:sigma-70 family RNA polymerase sigma factor [Polaribacter pacificus]GGH03253.1 RNA polymerase sigma factor [Polaribacter pacificus]